MTKRVMWFAQYMHANKYTTGPRDELVDKT